MTTHTATRLTTARKLLIALTMWLPPAVILVTRTLWIDALPPQLPTHWGPSGSADSVTDAGTFFAWVLGISVTAALIGVALLFSPGNGSWKQRATAGVLGAATFVPLAMWLGSAAPSRGVTDPYTVELGAWFLLTLFALVYGLVPLLLYPKLDNPAVKVVADAEVESVELEPGEIASWSRTITSKMFIVVTIVIIVSLGLLYIPVIISEGIQYLHWSVFIGLGAVLLVAAFCMYRVSVDRRGLRVSSWLFGFPIKRLSPEQIAKVEVAQISPGEWGGWGYRISPGRSAIVLKQGPGLVVTQSNGKLFALTIDNPEQPVGVMRGLLTE